MDFLANFYEFGVSLNLAMQTALLASAFLSGYTVDFCLPGKRFLDEGLRRSTMEAAVGIYEFFMGILRHFYSFCFSIDLLKKEKHQYGTYHRKFLECLCERGANLT
jgi:hypothetical protein